MFLSTHNKKINPSSYVRKTIQPEKMSLFQTMLQDRFECQEDDVNILCVCTLQEMGEFKTYAR